MMLPPLYMDNIIFFLQRVGGISVYWHELIIRMLRDQLPVNFIEQTSKSQTHSISQPSLYTNLQRKESNIPHHQIILENRCPLRILRYISLQIKLPARSILHESYYRTSCQKDIVKITTVYDFIYERFRHGLRKWVHIYQKRQSLPASDHIICISQSTKNDLLTYYPQISPQRITVIYLGISEKFQPLHTKITQFPSLLQRTPLLHRPYILFVGERGDYKNFINAVLAVSQFSDLCLIAVGGKLAFTKQEQALIQKYLPGRFAHLPGISTEELNILYNFAVAFLYPSSYEGFGLPVVEAMRAGCPVIATNASSIPEICQQAGLLVNTPSPENLAEKLQLLYENATLRQQQIQAGLVESQRFTWENCYQETLAVYRKTYQEKFG